MSYAEWKSRYVEKKFNEKSADKPQWALRDSTKILSKEEYRQLRELAEIKRIYLSGVKNFDGKFETVKEVIETLSDLQNKFPNVVSGGKRLTLTLNYTMDAEDFAVTTKIRNVNLNADAYRDVDILRAEYQKSVKEGWFVKGTDYRAIIHHEFGHIVANVYKIDSLKIACEVTGLSPKQTLDWLKKNLSAYASSFADGGEIISEVFADLSTGKPSDFSRKFYDRVFELTR